MAGQLRLRRRAHDIMTSGTGQSMVVGTRVVKLCYKFKNDNIHLSAVSAMKLKLKCIRGLGSYMHNAGRMTELCRAQSQTIFVTERTVKLNLNNGEMTNLT